MTRRDIALLVLLCVAMFANAISTLSSTSYKKARRVAEDCREFMRKEYVKLNLLVVSNRVELASIAQKMVNSTLGSSTGAVVSPADLPGKNLPCKSSGKSGEETARMLKFDYFEVGRDRYAAIDGQYYKRGDLSPYGILETVLRSGVVIGGVFYGRSSN